MERDGAPVKFGTFGGVFTPCVLTILGVIMFLRFGLVVGQEYRRNLADDKEAQKVLFGQKAR